MSAVAIRVARRAKTGGHTAHLLVDPARTYCGLAPEDLDVVEWLTDEADVREIEACHGCRRTRDRVKFTATAQSEPAQRVTAEPRAGRTRRVGPLNHGTRSRGRQGFYR